MATSVRLRNFTFLPRQGALYVAPLSSRTSKRLENDLVRSSALLLEDGTPIGPRTDLHEAIARLGGGRFSLWGNRVYFSSSDGSNCRRNRRKYTLWIPSAAEAAALRDNYLLGFSKDSAALLRALLLNAEENNSFVNNFFRQYQAFASFAEDVELTNPKDGMAVIVGSGQMPWTSLRFLAEGWSRVVANDLMPVTQSFGSQMLGDLAEILSSIGQPEQGQELLSNLGRRPNTNDLYSLDALTVLSEVPIEEANIADDCVDLIFSVSVLEHVSNPPAVYAAFRRMMKRGGLMYHSIDLRDHRSFADPFAFLTMSRHEYSTIATENRLRVTEHLSLLAEHGFEVIKTQFQWSPVLDFSNSTDWTLTRTSTAIDQVTPTIAPGFRAALNEDFAEMAAIDLATQSVQILARAR